MSRSLERAGRSGAEHGAPVGVVHLVYPHGPEISAPDAIGRHLGERLERHYSVVYHDWTEKGVIGPNDGDILVGHPHPSPLTIFRRSCRRKGWGRKLMLSPFNGDPAQVAFLDGVIGDCDLYLAISGPYWFTGLGASIYSHWEPKMRRVDLAVDRQDYPPVKVRFNERGRRRLVYVGHQGYMKNTGYLSQIADQIPGVEIGWIGPGDRPIRGLRSLGWQDFTTPQAKELISSFDFMITVGSADANPTTILEAMAWGLIPICTPQSGYARVPGIVNIELGDPHAAASVIRDWLDRPEAALYETQRVNWSLLDRDYTWDRFAERVAGAIEAHESPPLGFESSIRRARFAIEVNRSRAVRQLGGVPSVRRRLRALRHGWRHVFGQDSAK